MVYLNRIYTKTGDAGETGLGDGSRVPKNDPRIEAIGVVDELNSTLGLLLSHGTGFTEAGLLQSIQNDLFDVGADLCVPFTEGEMADGPLRVTAQQVKRLEGCIDRLNGALSPLHSFILPGGSSIAAWCHFSRTVCRRAERAVVTLMGVAAINPESLKYLNRLSDFLFVLARHANDNGASDILWVPGANRPNN